MITTGIEGVALSGAFLLLVAGAKAADILVTTNILRISRAKWVKAPGAGRLENLP
jgi:hypothetical protein